MSSVFTPFLAVFFQILYSYLFLFFLNSNIMKTRTEMNSLPKSKKFSYAHIQHKISGLGDAGTGSETLLWEGRLHSPALVCFVLPWPVTMPWHLQYLVFDSLHQLEFQNIKTRSRFHIQNMNGKIAVKIRQEFS